MWAERERERERETPTVLKLKLKTISVVSSKQIRKVPIPIYLRDLRGDLKILDLSR